MSQRLSLRRLRILAALTVLATASGATAEDAPSADLVSGERIWQRCAVCHGADGAGRPDGTFPRIAGQHDSVVRAQLAAIRSGTRSNPVMQPHVEDLVDDRELADVAAYVAALPRRGACGLGPGNDLERGERIYRETCESCHGDDGLGDAERLVPVISCQHYAYLLRRARDLASWSRNGHPATERPLDAFTDPELRAVMDYAARLGAVAAPPDSTDASDPGHPD